MKVATYNKIISSTTFQDTKLSLGFRRWHCLPARVRKSLGAEYLRRTGSTNQHDYMVAFFGAMSAGGYRKWILNN